MVFVNNNGKKILIQTPKMYLPSGANRWRQKDALDNKSDAFELELSFGGDSPDIQLFHEKMKQYDEIVKNKILQNPKDWLGKSKVSMETVEDAFYSPVVRLAYDKDHNRVDYPDRMKIKIDRERTGDDNFTGRFVSSKKFNSPVLAFDTNKNQLEFNESNYDQVIPKGSHIICVVELVYITIAAKVSTKWKLVQFKVFKNEERITSYAIEDSDEEVEEVEEGEEEQNDSVDNTHPVSDPNGQVDDSEECDELKNLTIKEPEPEHEEEEEEEKVVPVQVVVPAKKVATRRKKSEQEVV
jgi:hypothetical protein